MTIAQMFPIRIDIDVTIADVALCGNVVDDVQVLLERCLLLFIFG